MIGRLLLWPVLLVISTVMGQSTVFRLHPDFKINKVFIGLPSPVKAFFVPGSQRVVIVSKAGQIFVYQNITAPSTSRRSVLDIRAEVHGRGDLGLLDALLHPEFNQGKRYIYLHYVAEPAVSLQDNCANAPPPLYLPMCPVGNRVVRYTVNNDFSVLSERAVLMDGTFCMSSNSHGPGGMVFDPSGFLYIAFGDGAQYDAVDYGFGTAIDGCHVANQPMPQGAFMAQFDYSIRGKLIRISPAGVLKTTGLWVEGTDYRVVAKGLRNPFRLAVDKWGGVAIANVGWNARDSMVYLSAAELSGPVVSNLGWPCWEGGVVATRYVEWLGNNGLASVCAPLLAPNNSVHKMALDLVRGSNIDKSQPLICKGFSSAPTGVSWYTDGYRMPRYSNNFFMNDYAQGCAWTFPVSASGVTSWGNATTVWSCGGMSGECGVVDMVNGPDGYMYMVDLEGGSLLRLASVDDQEAVDNGALFAVASIPGVSFALTSDHIDRQWSCCGEATFNLAVTPQSGLQGAPTFSISVSHCQPNPCTGANDCHQHTVSNFFVARDVETGSWGGWFTQISHPMESQVTISALSLYNRQYVKTDFTTHARTFRVSASVRPASAMRMVLEDLTCWDPPCFVEKMAGTYVALAALPINSALGDLPHHLVDWSVYDAITGYLVLASDVPTQSVLVDRDLDFVALYEPVTPTLSLTVPTPTGTSAKADYGFMEVEWTPVSIANTDLHAIVRVWSTNGVLAAGAAVMSSMGFASIPIPTNVSVPANIEMYHYNPATRQRGLRAIVGITMTTTTPSPTSTGSCTWALSVPMEVQILWEEDEVQEEDTSSHQGNLYPGFQQSFRFKPTDGLQPNVSNRGTQTSVVVQRPDRKARQDSFRNHFASIRRKPALKSGQASEIENYESEN